MSEINVEKLAELIKDTTAARGIDLYMIEEYGLTAVEWAEMTGRSQSTVSRNVRRAKSAESRIL